MLASRLGERAHAACRGPLTAEVDAEWVFDDADPRTAYIECAQACGLALLGGPPTVQTALAAHSRGVGPARSRPRLPPVRAGSSSGSAAAACTDGGRGMVEALGGLGPQRRAAAAGRRRADRRHRRRAPAARADGRGAGVRAAEGRRPGDRGAARAAADRRGRPNSTPRPAGPSAPSRAQAPRAASGPRCWRWAAAASPARRSSPNTPRLADDVAAAELIITGEGRFDDQSLHGKVVSALAAGARGRHPGAGAGRAGHPGRVRPARRRASAPRTRSPTTPDRCSCAIDDAANQLTGLAEPSRPTELGNSGETRYR